MGPEQEGAEGVDLRVNSNELQSPATQRPLMPPGSSWGHLWEVSAGPEQAFRGSISPSALCAGEEMIMKGEPVMQMPHLPVVPIPSSPAPPYSTYLSTLPRSLSPCTMPQLTPSP